MTAEQALSRSRPELMEKRFRSKENFYINIGQARADGDTFKETIKHFEVIQRDQLWEEES